MSHEQFCFAYMMQAVNAAPYPTEFDSLIGKKMLFAIDRSATHPMVNESSYRVKRICMDPLIVDEFCVLGSFTTPTKVGAVHCKVIEYICLCVFISYCVCFVLFVFSESFSRH
jgi:hypothetical protein